MGGTVVEVRPEKRVDLVAGTTLGTWSYVTINCDGVLVYDGFAFQQPSRIGIVVESCQWLNGGAGCMSTFILVIVSLDRLDTHEQTWRWRSLTLWPWRRSIPRHSYMKADLVIVTFQSWWSCLLHQFMLTSKIKNGTGGWSSAPLGRNQQNRPYLRCVSL